MLFCFVFLTSCRATRQETQKSTSTSENFSEKRESYRDTVLFAPASSTSLKISVNEFFKDSLKVISKPKVFTQKNGNATAKVRIERDTIFVTATCDSLALRAKIKSELQKEFSASTKDQATELSKETGYNFIDIISFLIAGIVIGFVGTITIKGIL
jgi:excinuclease UvrABC helicase subunit UvrB